MCPEYLYPSLLYLLTDDGAAGPVPDVAVGDVGDDAGSCECKLHCHTLMSLISDMMMALTVTPGHRVTPPPVRLADGSIARPGECHPLLAPRHRDTCHHDSCTRERLT